MEKEERKYRAYHKKNKYMCEIDEVRKDSKGKIIAVHVPPTNKEMPDLTGCTCIVGIDYAQTTDFVSAGLLFKYMGKHYWITHSWVCENCADLGRIKAPL